MKSTAPIVVLGLSVFPMAPAHAQVGTTTPAQVKMDRDEIKAMRDQFLSMKTWVLTPLLL